MCAEATGQRRNALGNEHFPQLFTERLRLLRARGFNEVRPSPVARVRQKRKLLHQQHAAALVLQGQVHLIVLILEHAKAGDFVRAIARVRFRIALLRADQHEKAVLNFRNALARNRDRRATG